MKEANHYASQLWQARMNGTFCDPITAPLSVADAYSIQYACTQAASSDIAVTGYKIGATSNETLDILGLEQPFFGPLYSDAMSKNDGLKDQLQLPLFTQHNPRVEAEFVACMKTDLARGSGDANMAIADIIDHIDWVAPGLEIVASRFSKIVGKPGCLAIADFGGNQHMIVGQPYHAWRELDLSSHPVFMEIHWSLFVGF